MEEEVGQAFLQQSQHHLLNDFYPRISACLQHLDENDLWWRPTANCNSIGNLILHLCGNVRQWIIAGIGGAEDLRNRSREFSEAGPISRDELVNRLESTLQEAIGVLQRVKPEDLLEKRRIQVYQVSLLQAVLHVVEHFSHHTGQIILLTKLRKNVDLKFFDL